MDYLYNVSKSSKTIINFALLFFWISFSILAYVLLLTLFAVLTGQAIWNRAIITLLVSIYGLFVTITVPLQIVNQYNRIRVTEDGFYIEVYVFRYSWKFVSWNDVLELKLLPKLDRRGKHQWLVKVRNLTYWHRWISWQHQCGSDPGIVINSDLLDGDKFLEVVEENLEGEG